MQRAGAVSTKEKKAVPVKGSPSIAQTASRCGNKSTQPGLIPQWSTGIQIEWMKQYSLNSSDPS